MPAGVSACSPEGQKIKAEHEAKKVVVVALDVVATKNF